MQKKLSRKIIDILISEPIFILIFQRSLDLLSKNHSLDKETVEIKDFLTTHKKKISCVFLEFGVVFEHLFLPEFVFFNMRFETQHF